MNADLADKILEAYREATAGGEDGNRFDFPWSVTVYGSDGRSLYVHERADRPGSLRVRWQATSDERDARGCASRPTSGFSPPEPIRDNRGRLRRKAIDRAIEAGRAEYEAWLHPAVGPDGEPEGGRLRTLEAVLRYFVDPKTGPAMDARWREESVGTFPIDRDRRTHVNIIREVIGLDIEPAAIRLAHARRIWRAISEEHNDSGSGGRWAEQVVGTLQAALTHARTDELIGVTDGILPKGWRAKLRSDWTKTTGEDPFDPDRPPYSSEETARIIAALPQADPRLRLAIELGIGYRVGQLANHLTRSGIVEGGPLGLRVQFMDAKRERTVRIDLPPRAQRALRHAWQDGHLRELEEAYQAKRIEDYYIAPAGRTLGGACQVAYADQPMDRTALYRLFLDLERAAGVEHVYKRGWHGLRRAFESLIGEQTADSRVRDMAQGWAVGGGTRETIYTDTENELLLAEVAGARSRALDSVRHPATTAERAEELADEARALLARLAELGIDAGGELGQDLEAVGRQLARAEAAARAVAQAAAPAHERPPELTREEAEALHYNEVEAAVRDAIRTRGLTGKAAAEMASAWIRRRRARGVSPSDVSAVMRGRGRRIVSIEKLRWMLASLTAPPDTGE